MYHNQVMTVLVSFAPGEASLGDEGSPEEQVYVEALRAGGDVVDERPFVGEGGGRGVELALLACTDVDALSTHERLTRLAALDRVVAEAQSLRAETLVALAGAEPSGQLMSEVHVEHEVALATRTSRYSAGRAIETARALATVFTGYAEALRDGRVSAAHCSVLVERTRVVTDPEALRAIESRSLRMAERLTPGEFARELAKVIVAVDPDAAGRSRRARETRRVWARPLDDGLAFLGLVHDQSTIDAIHQAITTDARALRGAAGGSLVPGTDGSAAAADSADTADTDADTAWERQSLDSLRADALAARVLGRVAPDGSVVWDRSEARVVVNVVLDLDTLRTEQAAVDATPAAALLDGEPIPASLARELAEGATWWRRWVIDPVDGHLIDEGTATYLPARLRRFVLARDGACRAPGCTNRAASRLQMDHALEFPEGASSAANCGALCTTCHQLKTAHLVDIEDSRADGSCTWRTSWGQRIELAPRPVLADQPPRPPLPVPPGRSVVQSGDPPPF
jgi:hypothetical protein